MSVRLEPSLEPKAWNMVCDTLKADTSIRFLPWIGPEYVPGRGLLLLGESHYSKNVDEPREFTHQLTAGYLDGKMRHRFWTRAARLIEGRPSSSDQARQIWRGVAFFNYVQEIVGPGARQRPSEASWQASEAPFRAVLAALRPAHLLVLGTELWRRLPAGEGSASVELAAERHPVRFYREAAGRVVRAMFVRHPASFGFSWRKWHPVVAALVTQPPP